jgi:hypothetical protein
MISDLNYFWNNSKNRMWNFKLYNMKTLKLIFASLIISFGVNAQTGKMTKLEKVEKKGFEERAKIQTDIMKKELDITSEQYEKAYQINVGINQKNDALREQKITEKERKEAVKSNNEARIAMLKEILTDKQYATMLEKLKEEKYKEIE